MPPTHLSPASAPVTGRNLSFREREEIALECARGTGVRAVARKLGRAPSTISREIRRNSVTRGGDFDYRAITAQWHADRAAQRPKAGKLTTNPALRDYVQDRLGVFDRIFAGLAGEGPKPERIMIDATHLKAHRTAASLLKKGMFPVVSGEPRAG